MVSSFYLAITILYIKFIGIKYYAVISSWLNLDWHRARELKISKLVSIKASDHQAIYRKML